MNPEDIKLLDWIRWLIGDVPASFYIELIVRAVFIYMLLMVSMRLLGKRMSSQLGRNDLIAMVTLAATIGIPLQAPERGLLPAIIIAAIVVLVSRYIAGKALTNERFESFSQGKLSILVKDAVMDLTEMKRVRVTRERLVAQLRYSGVKQLGQVKRLYMEANGTFTITTYKNSRPGLFIIPRWDDELYQRFERSDDFLTCENCGFTRQKPFEPEKTKCESCGHNVWTPAVMEDK